jgi:hypothetical protein
VQISQDATVLLTLLADDEMDVVKEPMRVEPERTGVLLAEPEQVSKGCHSHSEELIEIGREYSAEEEALE